MLSIGFLGAGNMARALGGGIAARQAEATEPTSLFATDPEPAALQRFVSETGGRAAANLADLVRESSVVVLAVKPQVLPQLLPAIREALRPDQLVVSIAAGTTLGALTRGLGPEVRLVRAMPNTPALVRAGMTVLVAGPKATPDDLVVARRIFASVGEVAVVDDEALLDAVTAVSGSGPGFLFAYGEAMLAAAHAAGLPEDLALTLVRQTVLGSALLWRESSEPVSRLREMVTSPGGTTKAGLDALAAAGFAQAIAACIDAATRRSRELAGH
jgi:pyrroline-5-carboxylate reductase